jgi:hydroxymethylpyrimidine pyrophosphatase-like HAD family hydrolase
VQRIVLLDVDATLIDKNLLPTSQGGWDPVRKAVLRLQAQGARVGLNSDTPLQTLQEYSELLGLEGPIVGELGQVVSLDGHEKSRMLGKSAAFFSDFRKQIIGRLLDEADHPLVCIGDVNKYPRKVHGKIHQRAFLINGMRQCSFSMFVFGRIEDELVIQDPLLDEALALMKATFGERLPNEFRFDEDRASGILIMHENLASKSTAYSEIIKHFGSAWSYAMIGDGDSDVIQGTPVPVTIHAVGNAKQSVQNAARLTGGISAAGTITAGVIDILNRLADETTIARGGLE